MTSIRKSAESLLSLVATSPDPDALDVILSQHWDCFDMETCGICDFIDEELSQDLLFEMSRNESLTVNLQDRILEAAQLWQGREYGVVITLAANPSISDSIKVYSLDADYWYGSGEGEEIVADFLRVARSNKRYLKSEVQKFVERCSDAYGFDDDPETASGAPNPARGVSDESLADDDDYDLTGLDILTVEVLVQLQQLLDNENIECINLFDENKNAIFSVRHEYDVIDTSFSKALGRKIRAFAPIDDEEDAAKKHVNLLPEDFFSNELVDTGFQLIEELLRLSDCDQSGDVFAEIVLRNKRGVKGNYNLPKA